MNTFFVTVMVGISLSMDAFSLALGYGTLGLKKRNQILLSLLVGIFHFFMPLIGLFVGDVIYKYFIFDFHLVVGVIFGIIGVQMLVSSINNEEISPIFGMFGYLLFGFSVSIDSFTTGIGLKVINDNYLEVSSIFMFCSSLFTYMGLKLGCKLSDKFGKYATILGGLMLVMFSLYYFFGK